METVFFIVFVLLQSVNSWCTRLFLDGRDNYAVVVTIFLCHVGIAILGIVNYFIIKSSCRWVCLVTGILSAILILGFFIFRIKKAYMEYRKANYFKDKRLRRANKLIQKLKGCNTEKAVEKLKELLKVVDNDDDNYDSVCILLEDILPSYYRLYNDFQKKKKENHVSADDDEKMLYMTEEFEKIICVNLENLQRKKIETTDFDVSCIQFKALLEVNMPGDENTNLQL